MVDNYKIVFTCSLGPDKILYALYLGEANSTVSH